jgi:Mg2+-importing ATPase
MSAYGALFGFVPLPRNYGLTLFGMMLVYIPLTQFVKSWYVRRYGI